MLRPRVRRVLGRSVASVLQNTGWSHSGRIAPPRSGEGKAQKRGSAPERVCRHVCRSVVDLEGFGRPGRPYVSTKTAGPHRLAVFGELPFDGSRNYLKAVGVRSWRQLTVRMPPPAYPGMRPRTPLNPRTPPSRSRS